MTEGGAASYKERTDLLQVPTPEEKKKVKRAMRKAMKKAMMKAMKKAMKDKMRAKWVEEEVGRGM